MSARAASRHLGVSHRTFIAWTEETKRK
jgi:transposase